jgi:hypothetical protein
MIWAAMMRNTYRLIMWLGWDGSDSPVQLSHPCAWSETVRWGWTTTTNAPLLGVWSFPSFHLVAGKTT